MENAEEIYHFLEEFSKRKPKTIPQELNDYLAYVARTGDPVYQWSLVKSLFKEKLLNVITDFYETTPSIDIPPYPNVDPFNYDIMKNSLLERLDSFTAAPFTVQRICELLTCPRKQYNRIDKFMRAIEKNILVVSTREPGSQRHVEPENGEPMEPIVNGSDNNSECNVDIEMEDVSWKENNEQRLSEPQPSSSDSQISVDDVETRLQAKEDTPMETQDKSNQDSLNYESVTPPESNTVSSEEAKLEKKPAMEIEKDEEKPKPSDAISSADEMETCNEPKADEEIKIDNSLKDPLAIPEIRIEDADMTEKRLLSEANSDTPQVTEEPPASESEPVINTENKIKQPPQAIDECSSDSNTKEDLESKVNTEISTSSEESSSSENTDGNSNSPKTDNEPVSDTHEESNQSDKSECSAQPEVAKEEPNESIIEKPEIKSENYSISDVNSELPQPPVGSAKSSEVEPEITKNTDVVKDEKTVDEKVSALKTNEERVEETDTVGIIET